MKATVLLLVALAQPPIAVNIVPHVVQEGGAANITCRVQRSSDNREVTWGIEGLDMSSRSMDGEAAPITYERVFLHIPCMDGVAFCSVLKSSGKSSQVETGFVVAGCQEEER